MGEAGDCPDTSYSYEATRGLQLSDVEIETPICKTIAKELKGKANLNVYLGFRDKSLVTCEKEFEAIYKVLETVKEQGAIQCTACRYCVDGCPANIPIPEVFACLNAKKQFKDWNPKYYCFFSTSLIIVKISFIHN